MNRFQSLRTSLIAAFLGVVAIALFATSLMLVLANTRAAEQENKRQLSIIASYKSQAISEWANVLTYELNSTLLGEDFVANVENMFQPEAAGEQVSILETRVTLRHRLLNIVGQSRYFDELMLVDETGTVRISSSQPRVGSDFSREPYFVRARENPYISTPTYSSALRRTELFVGYPINDENGQLVGVLVGRAKFELVEQIFQDPTGFREPGDTYLATVGGTVISGSVAEWRGQTVAGLSRLLDQSPAADTPIVGNYENLDRQPVLGAYITLPELSGILVVEQTRSNITRSQLATLMVNLSVILASILLAVYVGLIATRSIAGPVNELAGVADRIAHMGGQASSQSDAVGAGYIPALAPTGGREEDGVSVETAATLKAASADLQTLSSERGDELGVLANAFNQMTLQLSDLIGGLEQIVADRTKQLAKRSSFLEASADISRVTTSILDPERLINQAVELIRDRFDLYYVGLFLADREGQWAVLRSGTGEAGKAMLGRGHRLRIEPSSMIGWCISNAQARIAQVASMDEVRRINPDLPDTRSEAALPLRVRGQVIGALTVQSDQPNAYDQATINVLQTMADQLATAIENAQLYAQSRHALDAERRAYSQAALTDWRNWLGQRSQQSSGLPALTVSAGIEHRLGQAAGMLGSGSAVVQKAPAWNREMQQAFEEQGPVQNEGRLAIPIRVRGAVIGVMHTAKPQKETGAWSSDEVAFLESITEQLGVALDSARLYAETRQRAEQERLVDEITGRMRATLDLQSVLEIAARDLRDTLGLAEVEVRLGAGTAQGYGGNNHE